MNDVKRHRRWRDWSAWILAFGPWIVPLIAWLGGMLPGAGRMHSWSLPAMIGLCTFYSSIILAMWQPWKRKDK